MAELPVLSEVLSSHSRACVCADGCAYSNGELLACIPGARTLCFCAAGLLVGSDLGSMCLLATPKLHACVLYAGEAGAPLGSWQCFKRCSSTSIIGIPADASPSLAAALCHATAGTRHIDAASDGMLGLEGTSDGNVLFARFTSGVSCVLPLRLFNLFQPIILVSYVYVNISANDQSREPVIVAVGAHGRLVLAHAAWHGYLRVRDRYIGEQPDRAVIVNNYLVLLCYSNVACVPVPELLKRGGSAPLEHITNGAIDIASSSYEGCVSVYFSSLVDHPLAHMRPSYLDYVVPPSQLAKGNSAPNREPEKEPKDSTKKNAPNKFVHNGLAAVSVSPETVLEASTTVLEQLASEQARIDSVSTKLTSQLKEYADALHMIRAFESGGRRQHRPRVEIDATGDVSGENVLASVRIVNASRHMLNSGWMLGIAVYSMNSCSASQAIPVQPLLPNESSSFHVCLRVDSIESEVCARLLWSPMEADDCNGTLFNVIQESKSARVDALRASRSISRTSRRLQNPEEQMMSSTLTVHLQRQICNKSGTRRRHIPSPGECWRGTLPRWGRFEVQSSQGGKQLQISGSGYAVAWLVRASLLRRAEHLGLEMRSLQPTKTSAITSMTAKAQELMGSAKAAYTSGELEAASACISGACAALVQAHNQLRDHSE